MKNMKLISKVKLVNHLKYKKKNNILIGFTNGCFDLLHAGHKFNLKYCKKNCDILIVALNSDLSIKRLKGPTRPIQNLRKRVNNLSKLDYVDFIIYFSKTSVTHLIKYIKPNIIFKGADYINKNIDGSDFIKKNNGQIIFTPIKKGYSTTNLIKKLNLYKR